MRYAALVGSFLFLVFAGCAVAPTASPTPEGGSTIKGMVYGGQQPIVGAHVYLFAANTSGYGGPGIAASSNNASISLLNAPTTGYADSIGAYVQTDAGGNFSVSGDYLCTPGQQVYLYVLGGNPGAGTNSGAGLMAILGTCPATATFAASVPFVIVNEVSTIAAAYSFAGFASDATHISSSGTPLALKSISNAFATSSNLYNLAGGLTALTYTPAGNGIVPQSEIHTLANILATCINSSGPASLQCATLFNNASSAGSSGTVPTETATAAINIAHNPSNAVAALFLLSSGAAPFQPFLTSSPSDFTLAIQFSGLQSSTQRGNAAIDSQGNVWSVNNANSVTKLSNLGAVLSPAAGFTGGGLGLPLTIAIDLNDNAWISAFYQLGSGRVIEFSNDGVVLSGANGYSGGGLVEPDGIAIDGSGNAWVADYEGGVTKLSSSGAPLSGVYGYSGGGLHNPMAIAIDGSGNAWVTNGNNSITQISNSGTFLSGSSGYIGGGVYNALSLAIDHAGNAWIANSGGNSVTKLSKNGAPLSGASGFTGGGLSSPQSIAIDGAGNAWTGSQTLVEISNSGVILSGSSGYNTGSSGLLTVAIDGAGNIWLQNQYGVTELVGAAIPVVTPLSAGVATNSLGSRP